MTDPATPPSRPHRAVRAVVAVAAFAFLFAPVLAYGFGQRAEQLENRALAARPSLSQGWDYFDQASAYAKDHLPMRGSAVRANERLSRDVFRQPPDVAMVRASDGTSYPSVVLGTDGWLYYGRDFLNPCDAQVPVGQAVGQLTRFTDVLRASGREVAVVIAPDKSEVATEHLPSRYLGRVCAQQRRDAFWTAYTGSRDSSLVDLRPVLQDAQQQPGGAYLPADSHWTPLGQNAFARSVVDAVAPGVWDDTAIRPGGTFRKQGDLGPFVQSTRVDTAPGFVVSRPGVQAVGTGAVSGGHLSPRLRATTSGPSRLVPGRTTLIGDSFTYNSVPAWQPWFSDVTPFHREKSKQATMIKAITASHTVVLEVVERDAVRGVLMPHFEEFLAQLEAALDAEQS